MKIAARLEQLRNPFRACRTVILADLSAALVLGTNSANTFPQEQLDRLGVIAGRLLNNPALASGLVSSPINTVLVMDGDTMQIFVTHSADSDVAICCTSSLALDTLEFTAAAQALLAEINGPG